MIGNFIGYVASVYYVKEKNYVHVPVPLSWRENSTPSKLPLS